MQIHLTFDDEHHLEDFEYDALMHEFDFVDDTFVTTQSYSIVHEESGLHLMNYDQNFLAQLSPDCAIVFATDSPEDFNCPHGFVLRPWI